jgi:hypothetical protein
MMVKRNGRIIEKHGKGDYDYYRRRNYESCEFAQLRKRIGG